MSLSVAILCLISLCLLPSDAIGARDSHQQPLLPPSAPTSFDDALLEVTSTTQAKGTFVDNLFPQDTECVKVNAYTYEMRTKDEVSQALNIDFTFLDNDYDSVAPRIKFIQLECVNENGEVVEWAKDKRPLLNQEEAANPRQHRSIELTSSDLDTANGAGNVWKNDQNRRGRVKRHSEIRLLDELLGTGTAMKLVQWDQIAPAKNKNLQEDRELNILNDSAPCIYCFQTMLRVLQANEKLSINVFFFDVRGKSSFQRFAGRSLRGGLSSDPDTKGKPTPTTPSPSGPSSLSTQPESESAKPAFDKKAFKKVGETWKVTRPSTTGPSSSTSSDTTKPKEPKESKESKEPKESKESKEPKSTSTSGGTPTTTPVEEKKS